MKKILIVSGVSIDRTPVVKTTAKFLNKNNICSTLEFKGNRVLFIFKFLKNILIEKNATIIFVGLQTLPLLFLSQIFTFNKIYWFLESYPKTLRRDSFALKLTFFEKIICWSKIYAVFPTAERSIPYRDKRFKKTIVLPNVPPLGRKFKARRISAEKKIRIAFYGMLDNTNVYVKEFVRFVNKYKELEIDFYGNNFPEDIQCNENVKYCGVLNHSELMDRLDDYNYSVVGYKPRSFNTKYCAPNKLYESLSLSLPVILNTRNPPLVNLSKSNMIGINLDFENLDSGSFQRIIDSKQYQKYNYESFKIYQGEYNYEKFYSNFESIVC